jgi:hypothetical protein
MLAAVTVGYWQLVNEWLLEVAIALALNACT